MKSLTDVRIVALPRRRSLGCKNSRQLPLIGDLIEPTIDYPFLAFASKDDMYREIISLFPIKSYELDIFNPWTLIAFGPGVPPLSTRFYDVRWPHAVARGREFKIPFGSQSYVTLRCTKRHGKSRTIWSIFAPDDYPFILSNHINLHMCS